MDKISFQVQTKLIRDPLKYSKAIGTTIRKSRNLKPENEYNLINGQTFTTSVDDRNLIVLVRSEKDGFLKFIPTSGEVGNLINDIVNKVTELTVKSKDKLTAWIIGGAEIKSKKGTDTIMTVNKLADVLCDRPDIDTSILAGNKNSGENIVIHTLTDGLEVVLEKTKNSKLEDTFDIIELNNTKVI